LLANFESVGFIRVLTTLIQLFSLFFSHKRPILVLLVFWRLKTLTPMNRLTTLKQIGIPFCLALFFLAMTSVGIASLELVTDGCTNPFACNYDASATDDDGSCEYFSCIGCTNQFACNFDPFAIYPDASCEFFTCAGCTAPLACNYDDAATVPDETACDFESCAGCMDFTACNFDPEATLSTPISCVYPLPDYDCEGNLEGCINCVPLFLSDFESDTVICSSELPISPDLDIVAVVPSSGDTLEVGSVLVEAIGSYDLNLASTSDGAGPDGAIRLFGLSEQLGLSNSDYFVESFPLIVTRYSNGVARVTGQVSDIENPNLKWNVHLVLEGAQSGTDWIDEDPNHAFMTTFGCNADTANWITYRMNNAQSYLIGSGGYEGSWLQLSHMPFSESKRFQLGIGGNSVNCNYGLGGWFAWEGAILGQSVMGMSGDLVVDLGSDVAIDVPCGSEFAAIFYNALNPDSGDFTEAVQFTYTADTVAPTMETTCENFVSLCYDVNNGVSLPDPCSFEADNCGGALEISVTEVVLSGDPDAGDSSPFEIERNYEAMDCSGNTSTFTQTLTFDGEDCANPEGLLDHLTAFSSEPATTYDFAFTPNEWTRLSSDRNASRLSPNPTSTASKLILKGSESANIVVRVFNLAGMEAMPPIQRSGNENNSFDDITLNGVRLIPGCYLVRVESEGAVETLRWVITR